MDSIPGTVISIGSHPEEEDEDEPLRSTLPNSAESGDRLQNQNNSPSGGYPTIIDMRNINEGENGSVVDDGRLSFIIRIIADQVTKFSNRSEYQLPLNAI